MPTNKMLDIAPLRSFVAVADCGGFGRAADSLHLSQAGVSQHVRRLESAVGRRLVERHGIGSRFTADGEDMLTRARRILALHDETLHSFGVGEEAAVVIGATEHAAAQLLPVLSQSLLESAPDYSFRFRIDRGARLNEGLRSGAVDVALLLHPADGTEATEVGDLRLGWHAAPGWRPPRAADPVPLVAFDSPCALRTRALETLAQHDVACVVAAEAPQLAGVQAAVGAGLGVALMATLGQTPAGLVRRTDLPDPGSLPLHVCGRRGLDSDAASLAVAALRPALQAQAGLAGESEGDDG